MCGILGSIGRQQNDDALHRGLDNLTHRGPDGSGVWKDENAMLGHRRLSIIDLSDTGKQPLEVLSRYVISYNGEIYNFIELRRELEAAGHRFNGQSDTEVLLYAFIQWGEKCLNKLNGQWAFAIWDSQEKTLFLSRDRLGQKPLFYHQSPENGFVFASEMKGIYPFLDHISIHEENFNWARERQFYYESTDRCLIEGIKRFPAASFAYFKQGDLKIEKYWTPPMGEPSTNSYEEHTETFKELFEDACKIRMRSDVTIGTALSGGLDSSAVICTMANIQDRKNIQKDWQHAFVATFPNSNLDETEYARAVETQLGIKADYLEVDPSIDIENIFEQTYMFEELFYSPPTAFVQLYKNMRKNGVIVSIDGHGADELFGGYDFDLIYALVDAFPNTQDFRLVRQMLKDAGGLYANYSTANVLKFSVLHKFPKLSKMLGKQLHCHYLGNLGFLNSQLYKSAFETSLPTLLRNYDRYSMMNGVEIRMPFLDYRMVDFAFSLPYQSKIHNGFTKSVIRDGLKDYLPEKVRLRKSKIGFNSPMDQWMRGQLKTWMLDTTNNSDFLNSSVIDGKSVSKDIQATINKTDLSFMEATNSFNKMVPYIWEQSLQFANKKMA